MSDRRFFAGVDLGQAADYTAIAVAERTKVESGEMETDYKQVIVRNPYSDGERIIEYGVKPKMTNAYVVRHLERLRLGTSYPAVVQRVRDMLAAPALRGQCELVVDGTGVGRPVVDSMREVGLTPCAVIITAGNEASQDGYFWHVPKIDLISTVQVLLQSRRLQIADSLAEAPALRQELADYQQRVTASANLVFGEWRSGKHDDLVLALALAVWRGESIRELHFY